MLTFTKLIKNRKIKSSAQNPAQSSDNTKIYPPLRHVISTSFFVILLICIELGSHVANAEYFSSVDTLRELGDVEAELLQAFRKSVELQEHELDKYRRFIDHVKLHHSIAQDDLEDYLDNPINAFTLIKRMVVDWHRLDGSITSSHARKVFTEVFEKFNEESKIPDEKELKGASQGLARLQKVYKMSSLDMANGEIRGSYTGARLSWNDCFEIGGSLFDQMKYSDALNWFNITLKKLHEIDTELEDVTRRRFEIETLEYIALTYYELGNSEKSIEYLDVILKLEPNHHTKDIRDYLEMTPPKDPPPINPNEAFSFMHNYTELCQGKQIPQKELRMLKCSIETLDEPNFLIAPLKIEQISEDPPINLYHGILTDQQINEILDEADRSIKIRSLIVNGSTNIPSDLRISQNAWLPYHSPVMKSVYRLTEQITGLNFKNAEIMQVANYGIGGQYEPHHDIVSLDFKVRNLPGSRIATSMFYLSDVEQGGFTVFPHINVFTRPIKGSLVNWFNLHKSLEPDARLLHAGCPVIIGSKRISNIWTHAGYQEFHRPCDLKSDTYKSEAYKKDSPLYAKKS